MYLAKYLFSIYLTEISYLPKGHQFILVLL